MRAAGIAHVELARALTLGYAVHDLPWNLQTRRQAGRETRRKVDSHILRELHQNISSSLHSTAQTQEG